MAGASSARIDQSMDSAPEESGASFSTPGDLPTWAMLAAVAGLVLVAVLAVRRK